MKTELSKLPDIHYPGSNFITFEPETNYLIGLVDENNIEVYKLISPRFHDIEKVININPLIYSEFLVRSKFQKPNYVIIKLDSSILVPKLIYRWNKDHWEKIKDVRTNIS